MPIYQDRLNLNQLQEVLNDGFEIRKKTGSHQVTLRATAKLIQDTHLHGRIGKYQFNCDEPPSRGGEDSAPSPLEYFLIGAVF